MATSVPVHAIPQARACDIAERAFGLDPTRARALRQLFQNAGVDVRHSVRPPADMTRHLTLTESNALYGEYAIALGRKVASQCLETAELAPEDIDLTITVSCTGLLIPSLDAHLACALGFRADMKRLPITELGCAAGACALARASDYLRGHPDQNVLVVAVELPSLTFQNGDCSPQNLVASALFGDGAAATVVRGRALPGAEILDTCSYQLKDTLDAMGFLLETDGLHIVLAKEMPALVSQALTWVNENFLGKHGLSARDLEFIVLHPGGRKILDTVQAQLDLPSERIQPSRDVLRAYGNLSAASVLFVLEAWQKRIVPPREGALGLMLAFGPGMSTEALLLRWR